MLDVPPAGWQPALLCDLDGTLIDSKASVIAAFSWWAELRGLPADVVDRIPHGRTSTDAAAMLAPELDAVREGELLDRRQAEVTAGVTALPGARELLGGANRLAIVTSCPIRLARARLKAASLPEPSVLVTPEQVRRGKPDPEGYLLAAERLRATPGECVVVEDAPAGVQAGVAAAMPVVAVLTTHTSAELQGASRHVAAPKEVLQAAVEISSARQATETE